MNWFRPTLLLPAILAGSCCVIGCPSVYNEACTPEKKLEIVKHHEALLAAYCGGQGADCAERAAIDAQFNDELQQWVRCQGKEPGQP